MARKKTGLGRGLDALIPGGETRLPDDGITQIPVENIQPNPRQPRAIFDSSELQELAASIETHGVIQPVIVKKADEPNHYILIAGERRAQAAKLAGLAAVPAIIRDATEQQLLELALIENVQRADLSPLEAAEAYRQLSDEFGLSQATIAERVGKSRVTVTNTMRLLKLSPAVQHALVERRISEGHARALLSLSTPQAQSGALQTIISKNLNVRQTEDLVRKLSGQKPAPKPKSAPSPEIKSIESQLRAHLGTKVTLNHKGEKGGSMTIHYYSEEELNTLIERLSNKA